MAARQTRRRKATTYAAGSFFGWLDYDENETEGFRKTFELFEDKETVDSIGIAPIRDALSNVLFPAISTIQTRPRYFFFVPWILQILQARRTSPSQFGDERKTLEKVLIKSLLAGGERHNVIGSRAGDKIRQFPSAVYWGGIQTLGIKTVSGSLHTFEDELSIRSSTRLGSGDIDEESEVGRLSYFDLNLPARPEGFPEEEITLDLTFEEADYLFDKVQTRFPESLLAQLTVFDQDLEDIDFPWDVDTNGMHQETVAYLTHARNFSDLMYGAQVLYWLLVAEHAARNLNQDTKKVSEDSRAVLDQWNIETASRAPEILGWVESDEFWSAITRARHGDPPAAALRDFVIAWARISLGSTDTASLIQDAEPLIVQQERLLKHGHARLTHSRPLENWDPSSFALPSRMNNRWVRGRLFVQDVNRARNQTDAES